jgi:hypothetical protein
MLAGEAVTETIPVPERLTCSGLLRPESVMVSVPVREPRAAGVKLTEIVQLFPAARVEGLIGQELDCLKSDRSVLMLETVMALLWPFRRVTFCTELVVPCTWFPKDKVVGEIVTDWAKTEGRKADTPQPTKTQTQNRNIGFTNNLGRKYHYLSNGALSSGTMTSWSNQGVERGSVKPGEGPPLLFRRAVIAEGQIVDENCCKSTRKSP